VHFFQSALFVHAADGADSTAFAVKEEVAWIKSHLDDVFARYIRSGITRSLMLADRCGTSRFAEDKRNCESAARSRGRPLISSVSREKLDLGF